MGWQSASKKGSFTRAILEALAEEYQFSLDTPFEEYPEEIQNILIHGTNGKNVNVHYFGQRGEGFYDIAFEGIIKNVERRYRETYSEASKAEYEEFMRITPCRACKGQRLKPGALAVTVGNHNIAEITSFSRNTCETAVLAGCRIGLSDAVACNRNVVRRRSAANPTGNTDWLRPGRCGIYSG